MAKRAEINYRSPFVGGGYAVLVVDVLQEPREVGMVLPVTIVVVVVHVLFGFPIPTSKTDATNTFSRG